MSLRIIVTGSRYWNDPHMIRAYFDRAYKTFGKPADRITIVHGGARGADKMAGALAVTFGFNVEVFEADWDQHGKAAGHIRNGEMIASGADAVVAFKDAFRHQLDRGGTENCVKQAIRAGIPWELLTHDKVA